MAKSNGNLGAARPRQRLLSSLSTLPGRTGGGLATNAQINLRNSASRAIIRRAARQGMSAEQIVNAMLSNSSTPIPENLRKRFVQNTQSIINNR